MTIRQMINLLRRAERITGPHAEIKAWDNLDDYLYFSRRYHDPKYDVNRCISPNKSVISLEVEREHR